MREIKFRIYSKVSKKMFILSKVAGAGRWHWAFTRTDFDLMQYTGLKDKNGKEIYEGDIVEVDDEQRAIEPGLHTITLDLSDDDFDVFWIRDETEHCEVIGNIYENPELLTNTTTT